MGFDITKFQRPADGAFYTSPSRLYRTAGGEICAEDDPRAAFLVVGEGGQIPVAEAREYGLVVDESRVPSTESRGDEPETADAPADSGTDQSPEDEPEPVDVPEAGGEGAPDNEAPVEEEPQQLVAEDSETPKGAANKGRRGASNKGASDSATETEDQG